MIRTTRASISLGSGGPVRVHDIRRRCVVLATRHAQGDALASELFACGDSSDRVGTGLDATNDAADGGTYRSSSVSVRVRDGFQKRQSRTDTQRFERGDIGLERSDALGQRRRESRIAESSFLDVEDQMRQPSLGKSRSKKFSRRNRRCFSG